MGTAPARRTASAARPRRSATPIHPGADFQTTSAGGVCNINWDYDCSGAVETDMRLECSGVSTCQTIMTSLDPGQCGMSVGQCSCDTLIDSNGDYRCNSGCGSGGVLGCR